MIQKQKGFSPLLILLVIIVIGVVGFAGLMVFSKPDKKGPDLADHSADKSYQEKPMNQPQSNAAGGLIWQQVDGGWRSMSTPPACTQPLLKMPADISKVTSVLYPGQTRGGNYKPHGGFRFDNTKDNKIAVTAPFEAYLVRGGSYIAEGEVQYTFDAMNNCGVLYRVGHIRELPDNLKKLADTWPAPNENSATQMINPSILVKQGETLGTKVGIIGTGNTFFDLGVYDYRSDNEASKSPAYQSAHAQDKDLSWHAVCWLKDWLPSSDQTKLLGLPAGDPASGKNSDYCK